MLLGSLRQKIVFAFYAIGSLIVGLAAVASADSVLIERKIQQGQKVSELFDAVLQIRRFEKNYLLYHERADHLETLENVSAAQHLLANHPEAFEPLAGHAGLGRLQEGLAVYADLFEGYARLYGAGDFVRAAAQQAPLRQAGKEVASIAEGLAAAERRLLGASVERQREVLIVAIVVITLLAVLVGRLVAGRVARALGQVEESTTAVARGQLARIDLPGQDREIVSLTRAFNRMLEEMERRQRHLAHTEKLAALGTLLSGVAHELNNPLSNISSSCQILLEEGEAADPRTLQALLAQIDDQTLRARGIVRSLLDFARKRETSKETQALAPLAEEAVRFLKGELPARIAVEFDIPSDLEVTADRQQLQHLLLNLVKNAIQALGESGRIVVSARRHAAPQVACAAGRAMVEIAVADDGPGIPSEVLARIFDPFFTTKPVGKGSGLGLYIAHEIVEEHEGCIAVDSPPGGGAAFHVWLPVPGEAAP
ncbi:MAG: ATP-binding protein [Magnetospirillum sp. WYHS-4]